MKSLILFLTFIIPLSSCKNGLVQEILPWNEKLTDVMPSTRSLQTENGALAVNFIDHFDSVVQQHQGYMQKVRGFFKAPESGEYKFYSSCSGPCQIFIGQEANKIPTRIINQKRESLHNEFNRYPDQVSHVIYLEKDHLYFIEGIEKQHGGLGHLSVGVVLPSDKKIFPISKPYLKTDANGDLKRKGEILRSNGRELTKQRDQMFTKLREINDYIRKLTDAVKRDPKKAKKNEKLESSQKIESDDTKKIKSTKKYAETTKERQFNEQEKGRTGINMNANFKGKNNMKSLSETNDQENSGSMNDVDEKKHMINIEDEGGKVNEEENNENNRQKVIAVIRGDKEHNVDRVNELMNRTEHKETYFKTRRNKGNITVIGKGEENEEEQNIDDANVIHPMNPMGNIDGEKNVTNKNKGEEYKIRPEKSNEKDETVTSKVVEKYLQPQKMEMTPETNDNLILEHNYVKVSKSSGQMNDIHYNDAKSTKTIDDDYDDDDDDILQLTSYAKKEISKHGDLPEKALRNLIKVIKQKMIKDGFVKQRNITMGAARTNEDKNNQGVEKSKMRSREANKNDAQERPNQKKGEGKIVLYDKVISNLVNAIKNSTYDQKDAENDGDGVRKGAVLNTVSFNEMEQRKRMLSSLYLLSSEIEKFRNVLKGVQNGHFENTGKLPGTPLVVKDLKSEMVPSAAGRHSGEYAKRDETNSTTEKNSFKINEGKEKLTESYEDRDKKQRNWEKNITLEKQKGEFHKSEDSLKNSALKRFITGRFQKEIQTNTDEIKQKNDYASKHWADKVGLKDITPELTWDKMDEKTNKIEKNGDIVTIKQALNRPLLVEGYTKIVKGISEEGKNRFEENKIDDEKGNGKAEGKAWRDSSRKRNEYTIKNAIQQNSYTDTLKKTVEQYLNGVTVPALLGDQTVESKIQESLKNDSIRDIPYQATNSTINKESTHQ